MIRVSMMSLLPRLLDTTTHKGSLLCCLCLGLLKGLLLFFHFLFVGEVFFIHLLIFLLGGFQWLLLTPFPTRHGAVTWPDSNNIPYTLQPSTVKSPKSWLHWCLSGFQWITKSFIQKTVQWFETRSTETVPRTVLSYTLIPRKLCINSLVFTMQEQKDFEAIQQYSGPVKSNPCY